MTFRNFPAGSSLIVAALLGVSALMAAHEASATSHTPATGTQVMADMAEAEVRKVDRDAKKITLRHGELKQLDMPPMTMVFQVKDASMLDRVKAGDKVRFRAQITGGAFIVTEIEPAR